MTTISVSNPGGENSLSYFDVAVSESDRLLNGLYDGYCLSPLISLSTNTDYSADVSGGLYVGDDLDPNGNGIPNECEVTSAPSPIEDAFALKARPNPFNPNTTIFFEVPVAGRGFHPPSPKPRKIHEMFDLSPEKKVVLHRSPARSPRSRKHDSRSRTVSRASRPGWKRASRAG